MPRTRTTRSQTLQDEIRKQIGSSGTARFLRAQPAFQVELEVPERFMQLLRELDRAEADRGTAKA